MATGYSRQSTGSIVSGIIVRAAPLNAEFNAILAALDASTGHNHDGTTGGGAPINLNGASIGVTGTLQVANGGTGATTASAARTALGLAIGSDVQAYDAGLASIAGLTTAADKMIYTTASDTYAVTDLTAFARTLLDDASAGNARTTLGLGTIATQNANSVAITGGTVTGITNLVATGGSITGGSITGVSLGSLASDLAVSDGGTGAGTAAGARANLDVYSKGETDSEITAAITQAKLAMFPVGSHYFTATNNNPGNFIGGTWEQVAEGRFIVGQGMGTDPDNLSRTYSVGNDSVGTYKHTLVSNEIPGHTHSVSLTTGTDGSHHHYMDVSTTIAGGHQHAMGIWTSDNIPAIYGSTSQSGNDNGASSYAAIPSRLPLTNSAGAHQHSTQGYTDAEGNHSHTVSGNTGSTGGGAAHENSPPAFGMYIWKRTA